MVKDLPPHSEARSPLLSLLQSLFKLFYIYMICLGMAMKDNIKSIWRFETFLRLVFVGSFVLCKGQEDMSSSIAPMKKQEQEALYSAIQGFVGDSWNGSDLYPDPCGWTPIQVLIILLYTKLINSILCFFSCLRFSC